MRAAGQKNPGLSQRIFRLQVYLARLKTSGPIEYEPFPEQEVHQGTSCHRDQVGDDIVHVELPHQEAHDEQIADERNGSVAQVELREPHQRLQSVCCRPVAPSEALMPEKIVDDGSLDGQASRQKVVEAKNGAEEGQGGKLDQNPDPTDEIKFQPADEVPTTTVLLGARHWQRGSENLEPGTKRTAVTHPTSLDDKGEPCSSG